MANLHNILYILYSQYSLIRYRALVGSKMLKNYSSLTSCFKKNFWLVSSWVIHRENKRNTSVTCCDWFRTPFLKNHISGTSPHVGLPFGLWTLSCPYLTLKKEKLLNYCNKSLFRFFYIKLLHFKQKSTFLECHVWAAI